jgi:hypothetical protein
MHLNPPLRGVVTTSHPPLSTRLLILSRGCGAASPAAATNRIWDSTQPHPLLESTSMHGRLHSNEPALMRCRLRQKAIRRCPTSLSVLRRMCSLSAGWTLTVAPKNRRAGGCVKTDTAFCQNLERGARHVVAGCRGTLGDRRAGDDTCEGKDGAGSSLL